VGRSDKKGIGVSKGEPTTQQSRVIPGWPVSAKVRTLVIVAVVVILLGGYLVVELIALSQNLDDLLNGKERV